VAALAIFALTYLAVAAGRVPFLSVDRPAAALLGAVLMVAAGVLAPAEAGAAVNGDTLGLLLGMMILSAYLGAAGFFGWASALVLRSVSGPRTLLWAIVFTAGVLTVIGSVANVIVLELAGSRASVGFWKFMRIGAAVTTLSLAAAVALLLAEHALGWV